MDAVDVRELAEILGGRVGHSSPRQPASAVRQVTIHSEHIMQGSVFFALPGTQSDGHRYVRRALSNGAVAAVVAADQLAGLDDAAGTIIAVTDPLKALQRLASWWRGRIGGTVVAVIGSSGKTVTKDALVHILASGRRVYGSPGSFNSKVGVPLALLSCPADCEVAVFEAAATAPGEMAVLADIIQPDHVLLTNLSSRHASNFASSDDQAAELCMIARHRTEQGWFLTGDTGLTGSQLPAGPDGSGNGKSLQYLRNEQQVPVFRTLETDSHRTLVEIGFPDGQQARVAVQTPFNEILSDVELAFAAAWLLGVDTGRAITSLADHVPTSSRMEVWQSPSGWTVVRDVATTDPVTLDVALGVSRRLLRPPGRFSLVLADPLASCASDAAPALGSVVAGSEVGRLWALDTHSHRLISEAALRQNPALQVSHFPDTDAMRMVLIEQLSRDDVVLIESPPGRTLAEVTSTLVEPLAANRLFIDRAALESNVLAFRRIIGPDVRMLAMVKGLAYGTNAIQVSQALQAAGVDQLGVATADEGIALRRANISLPVLVTLGTRAEVDKMVRHDLMPQVYSPDMLDAVIGYGRAIRRSPIDIHLEVDTGMHRTGFLPAAAIDALQRIHDEPSVRLAGLMTHFASADMEAEDDFTQSQITQFHKVIATAEELGFSNFVRHAANTAGTLRFPAARLDMVRLGIGLYGIHPSADTISYVNLSPVVGLVSTIVEVQDIAADDRIGYGGTYRVPETGSRTAVVPAGYHDCVPRAFSNFGYVSVDGVRCPIIGTVSMDSMVIDVTSCPSAEVGSDVLIFGRYGGANVPIEDVARVVKTIPYELLSRVGPRVQRILTQH